MHISVMQGNLTSPSVTRALYLSIFQYRWIETSYSLADRSLSACSGIDVTEVNALEGLILKRLRSERRVCSRR